MKNAIFYNEREAVYPCNLRFLPIFPYLPPPQIIPFIINYPASIISLGHYIYIETSAPARHGDIARLRSAPIPYRRGSQCLEFWYHMYGEHVNTTSVYIVGASSTSLEWTIKGNQGNFWGKGKFPIEEGEDEFSV